MARNLHERLKRLERQMPHPPALSDPRQQEKRARLYVLHFEAWSRGEKLDDISEVVRDAEMWAAVQRYGPVLLGLIWEGRIEGREELLGAGVDFNLAADCSGSVGGRRNPPGPDTPRKLLIAQHVAARIADKKKRSEAA